MKSTQRFLVLNFLCLYIFGLSACSTTTPQNERAVEQQDSRVDQKVYSNLTFGMLAPIIGNWHVMDWQLQDDGQWIRQVGAKWRFFPIQGGVSLQDEWISYSNDVAEESGYGTHIRVFDPLKKSWQAAWLSSRNRSIDLYQGQESATEVTFISQPNAKGRLTRTAFYDIASDSFKWRMDWSNDGGESWLSVYKVVAARVN